jgi:hypothetical protein
MKKLLLCAVFLFLCCEPTEYFSETNSIEGFNLENSKLVYAGKMKLCDGVYLKKFMIDKNWDRDRIYFIVDDSDRVIQSGFNLSKTVTNGKVTKVESEVIFK